MLQPRPSSPRPEALRFGWLLGNWRAGSPACRAVVVVVVTGTEQRQARLPGTSPRPPARPPAQGPRRHWLRFLPARTMKWMFKEDHALGKGGPGPGAARRRPRRPPSPVSPSAPGPPDSVCPGRLPEPVVMSVGGQPATALAEGWHDARGRRAQTAGDPLGGGKRVAIPAGSRPCGCCPLGLGHWRYYYYAMTNYEFCSQSTDVSSRQKSEPNTLTVSR